MILMGGHDRSDDRELPYIPGPHSTGILPHMPQGVAAGWTTSRIMIPHMVDMIGADRVDYGADAQAGRRPCARWSCARGAAARWAGQMMRAGTHSGNVG